jgi:hypothetical protein
MAMQIGPKQEGTFQETTEKGHAVSSLERGCNSIANTKKHKTTSHNK